MDDLARSCAHDLIAGRMPAAAELSLEIGEDGEPEVTLFSGWDPAPARAFRRLPESRLVDRAGRFFVRDASWGVGVPADPALAKDLGRFLAEHPAVQVDERLAGLLGELNAEHDRASRTVALSYAEDAELDAWSWEASSTRSSGPGCATRSSGAVRSSPTSRASERPCRRWPRSRPTMPSPRSWCAPRA